MDRFFSKLDLRDIKISPEGSSFPPDAEEVEYIDVEEAVIELDTAPVNGGVAWDSPIHHPQVAAPVEMIEEEFTEEVPVEHVHQNGDVLKVSAKSRPSAVAGAIAGVVRESGRAEVQAIGAGATNQAVKAVAIARDYLRETGIEAVCLPAFIDVIIDNQERTAIRMVVEPR